MATKESKQLISDDLTKFAVLLNNWGVCHDTKPLYDAAQQCISQSTRDFWHYGVESLDLSNEYFKAPGKTIPVGVGSVSIRLTVILKGLYHEDSSLRNPILDVNPQMPYCFDLELTGNLMSEYALGNDTTLFCSWHFDKSIKSPNGNKFIHPEFHWTFGGRGMEGTDIGQSFILPAPRIAHPPFDAILAIDYIIRHYMRKEDHEALTEESEYIEIVRRSQTRLWKPYAMAFASHWHNFANLQVTSAFNARTVFPELF